MKKRKKNIVYSTNPNYQYEYEDELENTIAKNNQNLKIHLNSIKLINFLLLSKTLLALKTNEEN